MWLHAVDDFIANSIAYFGQNIWIGILIAPLFGLLMSFTPCCLGQVAVAVRCVKGDTKRARLSNSLYFALGGAFLFVAVAVLVVLLGGIMADAEWMFHLVIGGALIVIIAWALFFDTKHNKHCVHDSIVEPDGAILIGHIDAHTHEIAVTEEVDCECHVHAHNHTAVATSKTRIMAHGFAGAVFAFPCSIPVLLAFLAFAQSINNYFVGSIMIALYIVGHNILPVIGGVSSKALFKGGVKSAKFFKAFKIAVLLLILAYAGLMIFEGLFEKLGGEEHVHSVSSAISSFLS